MESYSVKQLVMVSSHARIVWEESMRAAVSAAEQAHIKRRMEHTGYVDYDSL